jgi:hypothetical protein
LVCPKPTYNNQSKTKSIVFATSHQRWRQQTDRFEIMIPGSDVPIKQVKTKKKCLEWYWMKIYLLMNMLML